MTTIYFFKEKILMPTCPNCGETVMKGDPYCPHCSSTLKWYSPEDNSKEDSQYKNDEIPTPKEDYDQPNYLEGYYEKTDEIENARKEYIKKYDAYSKNSDTISAHNTVKEYLKRYPYDLTFMRLVSVHARQNGDISMLEAMYEKLGMD